MLRKGKDLTVGDVTSSRRGYSVHRKNLDAEVVWGFGDDLAGVAAPADPCFSSAIALLVMAVEESAELLLRSPALGANQIPWVRRTSAMCQRALLSLRSSSMPLMARLLGIRLPLGKRRE